MHRKRSSKVLQPRQCNPRSNVATVLPLPRQVWIPPCGATQRTMINKQRYRTRRFRINRNLSGTPFKTTSFRTSRTQSTRSFAATIMHYPPSHNLTTEVQFIPRGPNRSHRECILNIPLVQRRRMRRLGVNPLLGGSLLVMFQLQVQQAHFRAECSCHHHLQRVRTVHLVEESMFRHHLRRILNRFSSRLIERPIIPSGVSQVHINMILQVQWGPRDLLTFYGVICLTVKATIESKWNEAWKKVENILAHFGV